MNQQQKMSNLVWRVAEAPSGRYRSFFHRSWPMAHFKGPKERPAVQITCEHEYSPRRAREGDHGPLNVFIAMPKVFENGTESFVWLRLKKQAATLQEAKELGLQALMERPHFWPKDF